MTQKRRRSHTQASRSTPERKLPGWLWLLTGMVLGAFIMFLTHLSKLDRATSSPQTAATKSAKKTSELPAPVFEFYDRLKEEQVTVPEYDTPEAQAAAKQTHEYFLQVASFRNEKDSESLRARLILMNMEAKVESSTLQSGDKWHRVIIGPYQSKSRLAKARGTLVSNGLEYLTLKRPLTTHAK